MTAGLPLMKNVLTPLAKIVSTALVLAAGAAAATNTAIQKKNWIRYYRIYIYIYIERERAYDQQIKTRYLKHYQ